MDLWRKAAEPHWLETREEALQARFGDRLAIVSFPNRKRLQIEIACRSPHEADGLVRQFGGRLETLSRDWLKRFANEQKRKCLRIGKRLVVFNVGGTFLARRSFAKEAVSRLRAQSRHKGPSHLVIPAGMAFGTGDHATTAMSLRLLENLTRKWNSGWSMLDLGTGSGILALAARYFGAGQVTAIDLDPIAISTAKQNARLNKVDKIAFRTGDVRGWDFSPKIDIISANLFSQLLIEILPKLKRSRWLILSGIMRTEEKEFTRALRRNKIDIVEVRRRGKWIAMLAKKDETARTGV